MDSVAALPARCGESNRPTPMTDAETCLPGSYVVTKGRNLPYVPADFARSIERSLAAANERVGRLEGALEKFVQAQTAEQPESKNPSLWLYLQTAYEKKITFHSIGVSRMPDGGFHFYIHPQSVSGDTDDYLLWPDPFNWHDMLVNKKDSPEPDVEKFKKFLASQRALLSSASDDKGGAKK